MPDSQKFQAACLLDLGQGHIFLNSILLFHLYSLKTVIKFVSLCLRLLITNVPKCQDHGK